LPSKPASTSDYREADYIRNISFGIFKYSSKNWRSTYMYINIVYIALCCFFFNLSNTINMWILVIKMLLFLINTMFTYNDHCLLTELCVTP